MIQYCISSYLINYIYICILPTIYALVLHVVILLYTITNDIIYCYIVSYIYICICMYNCFDYILFYIIIWHFLIWCPMMRQLSGPPCTFLLETIGLWAIVGIFRMRKYRFSTQLLKHARSSLQGKDTNKKQPHIHYLNKHTERFLKFYLIFLRLPHSFKFSQFLFSVLYVFELFICFILFFEVCWW